MESSRVLSSEHAREAGVDRPWEDTNEAWWDWYLSLADRSGAAPAELEPVAPPPPAPALSERELADELAEPYPLTPEHVERFRAEGFIRLPAVLSAGALAIARAEVAALSAAAGSGPGASGFQTSASTTTTCSPRRRAAGARRGTSTPTTSRSRAAPR